MVLHDEVCFPPGDDCPGCFSFQCICPTIDYCNPDADLSINPSGCEHVPPTPCADGVNCTHRMCADNSDQNARLQCNGGLTYDQRKFQIEHCLFGSSHTCRLAVDAGNSCCGPAPDWPNEACVVMMLLDPLLMGPIACSFPAVPEEGCMPECTDYTSSCPAGTDEKPAMDVYHPLAIDGGYIGSVYCAGYDIMTDCGDNCDDACNESFCDPASDHCSWRKPLYCHPYGYGNCNDGLDCTEGDTCQEHGWSSCYADMPYIRKCMGEAVDCEIPFCTDFSDGLPGVDRAECRADCGDEHGNGATHIGWDMPPTFYCHASKEYNPPDTVGPHSGCFMWPNEDCHYTLPAEANACQGIGCTTWPYEHCFLQDIECPDDGAACSVEYCDPSSGCQRIYDDSLCDDAIGCTDDRCEPENDPPPHDVPWSGCIHDPQDQYCTLNQDCYDRGLVWCNPYHGDPTCGFCDRLPE
jgi:hypothetical protein